MVGGVIAEFNIFHNGHKYLIDKMRESADIVAAVISGAFVQRGDAAAADKWSRARAALMCGVDLVVELPVCCALGAAPDFAAGGVNTLEMLGADALFFGSECGDIDALTAAAEQINGENDEIKSRLSKGMSYPSVFGTVYGGIFSAPNNILAAEYIRAIKKYRSGMKPVTVKRFMTEHDGEGANGAYASASEVRRMLINGGDVSALIPYSLSDIGFTRPYSLSRLDSAFAARLRTAGAEELRGINGVAEGLENRIIRAARDNDTFLSIAEAVKTKRYTMSRVRRVLISALIGFTRDIYTPLPEYIRVLGMNKKGAELLKKAKKNCPVPIITKAADYKGSSRSFALDVRASDIAALCAPDGAKRKGGADFTHSPVYLI